MKKTYLSAALCLAVFALFANVWAAETFNLTTQTPTQGTNWRFDASVSYLCQGPGTGGHGLCPRTFSVPTLFVNNGANLTITGNSTVQQNIRVQVEGTVRITLNNANIERTGHSVLRDEPQGGEPKRYITVSPMQIVGEGSHLTLTLVGENTLLMENTMDARWSAGLGVPLGTSVVIEGDGKLTARGGVSAAGIGGHQGGVPGTHRGTPSGNITINSGTIIATGRELAAGIGNGAHLEGGTITINGGDVTATGGVTTNAQGNPTGGGAGIGGGGSVFTTGNGATWNAPLTININGGTVRAVSQGGSAGIGSGSSGTTNITININDGKVTALGGAHILRGGAGIGGGEFTAGGRINIRGGTVIATGESGSWGGGAGIGGGGSSGEAHGGIINISGGKIFARGGSRAEHIGGGGFSNATGPGASQGGQVRIAPDVEVSNQIPSGTQ